METEDNTLRDLKHFQDFLYRNFKNNEHYNKMYPTSNQPAQLHGTAKTHKHGNIDEINVQSLNFRPIIAQTGTCTYNAAQVISNYLKPLYTCNEYIIGNTGFLKTYPGTTTTTVGRGVCVIRYRIAI